MKGYSDERIKQKWNVMLMRLVDALEDESTTVKSASN